MARTAPLVPMQAVSGELPTDSGWLFEFKWDGIRALVDWDGAEIRIWSRNGNDVTAGYPELPRLAVHLGSEPAIIDGEIVVLDERGRPDFGLLQQRMHVRGASVVDLATKVPVHLFVFDVLRFGGHDTMGLELASRRELLERIELEGPAWRTPPVFVDEGEVVRDAAAQLGLEGVVAKRLTSRYEPGRRSAAWRKVKLVHHDEFVVGGFTVGDGRRAGTLGALLLGAHDPTEEGALRFVGSVGTGLSDVELQRLRRRLNGAVTGVDPFVVGPPRPSARFVEPRIVVEVRYGGWTRDRVLRHPSYLGERSDRPPSDVYLPAFPDERT